MIARVWRGWTTSGDADAYERLLRDEILPSIAEKSDPGYRGADVFRRSAGEEVEFMTVLRFTSMDAVREFAGDNVRQAHVPEAAQAVLSRFEDEATHYEVAVEKAH